MNPLIKWPGGKSGELEILEKFVPDFDRYIEPFFGGGAMFFRLAPEKAVINDTSPMLMDFYSLLKKQDERFRELLMCYNDSFCQLYETCREEYSEILKLYKGFSSGMTGREALCELLEEFSAVLADRLLSGSGRKLVFDRSSFIRSLTDNAVEKFRRTVDNNAKKPFSEEDLMSNLITGFTGGYYMYFRGIYNDLELDRIPEQSVQYRAANFFFIREYCYGSMFRYNSKHEFNIPYGGISYNTKNLRGKIDNMFSTETAEVFRGTEICCCDFEDMLRKTELTERDFVFLDPPYDTDFSDYEGKDFTKHDQIRLCELLKTIPAKFLLVIKNTDFISELYNDDEHFSIHSFDNRYTYNVRGRNEQKVKHLIITDKR